MKYREDDAKKPGTSSMQLQIFDKNLTLTASCELVFFVNISETLRKPEQGFCYILEDV